MVVVDAGCRRSGGGNEGCSGVAVADCWLLVVVVTCDTPPAKEHP